MLKINRISYGIVVSPIHRSDWSKESLPEPKKQKGERVRELEIALRKIIKAVESEDDVALSETLAEIHVMFPSL